MNVVYSPRAIRDLEDIAAYYRTTANERTAAAIGQRIGRIIDLVAEHPYSAPPLAQRRNVRAAVMLHTESFIGYTEAQSRFSTFGIHRADRGAPNDACRIVLGRI